MRELVFDEIVAVSGGAANSIEHKSVDWESAVTDIISGGLIAMTLGTLRGTYCAFFPSDPRVSKIHWKHIPLIAASSVVGLFAGMLIGGAVAGAKQLVNRFDD